MCPIPVSIMAHKSSTTSFTYSVTQKTSHTSLAFETVMSNLYASIGKPTDSKLPAIAANITSYDEINKEKFIEGVNAAVGPQGFMIFGVSLLNHFHLLLVPCVGETNSETLKL